MIGSPKGWVPPQQVGPVCDCEHGLYCNRVHADVGAWVDAQPEDAIAVRVSLTCGCNNKRCERLRGGASASPSWRDQGRLVQAPRIPANPKADRFRN